MLNTITLDPRYHQLKLHIQAQLGFGVQQPMKKAPETEASLLER